MNFLSKGVFFRKAFDNFPRVYAKNHIRTQRQASFWNPWCLFERKKDRERERVRPRDRRTCFCHLHEPRKRRVVQSQVITHCRSAVRRSWALSVQAGFSVMWTLPAFLTQDLSTVQDSHVHLQTQRDRKNVRKRNEYVETCCDLYIFPSGALVIFLSTMLQERLFKKIS